MAQFRTLAAALSTSVCIVALAAPAQAQEHQFNVPAGSLKSALDAYVAQSGTQLIYRPGDLGNAKSKGVSGTLPDRQALDRILAGSGFQAVTDQSGALAIVGNGASAAEIAPRGVISGQVLDERTGAALSGALVELVDSDQRTSTDELGEFRFSGLADGTYNIRVSYLGYGAAVGSVAIGGGRGARQRFELVGGNVEEEIVVYGERSARAQALNQERTAENSKTVISGDLLGNFGGTTISDGLRRAPGVAFQKSGDTGDGTNIIVRGLEPDLNLVQINGQTLPINDGANRSGNLSNILADSVSKITINSSLLPSQNSAGTGALVEIETKSPLDRPKTYFDAGYEFNRRSEGFGKDHLLTGTVSHKFGAADQFGISASLQYRKQDVTNLQYGLSVLKYGQYYPLEADGSLNIDSLLEIDPLSDFPFEEGADQAFIRQVDTNDRRTKSKTLTFTGTADWQPSDSFKLRFDYLRSQRKFTIFERRVTFGGSIIGLPAAVPSLDGDLRIVERLNNPLLNGNVFPLYSQMYSLTPNIKDITNTASLRGETHLGSWDINFSLGAAFGRSSTDHQHAATFANAANFSPSRLSEITLPEVVDADGFVHSYYAPREGSGFPLPLLSQAGWDLVNSTERLVFQRADDDRGGRGKNDRLSGTLSVRRNVNWSFLDYVEAGVFFERSKVSVRRGDSATTYNGIIDFSNPNIFPSAFDLGLDQFDEVALSAVTNSNQGFGIFDHGAVSNFFSNIPSLANNNPDIISTFVLERNPITSRDSTVERELSAYVQSRLQFGSLEIIGGARLNRVDVRSTFPNSPSIIDEFGIPDVQFATEFTRLEESEGTVTKLLPRVLANYRVTPNLIFRAAFGTTVARPKIRDLTFSQVLTLSLQPTGGPNGSQPVLTISRGNPELEPAFTRNFEAGIEWYDRDIGALKAKAFYKNFSNLLEQNVRAGVDSLEGVVLPEPMQQAIDQLEQDGQDLFIIHNAPVNNDAKASIWGLELSAEKRFPSLPGILSGLGVYANYTYTKSEKRQTITWTASPIFDDNGQFIGREFKDFDVKLPFIQQPKHSGTFGITYNKYGLDASVMYSFQSRRFKTLGPGVAPIVNLSQYDEYIGTLDANIQYTIDSTMGRFLLFIEGTDLLKDATKASVESSVGGIGSTPKFYTGGNFLGGRAVKLGVKASF